MAGHDARTRHAGRHGTSRRPAVPRRGRLGAAVLIGAAAAAGCLVSLSVIPGAAQGPTIIDQWSAVPVPPAPALKTATVDPKTTAYLILDIVTITCNSQARPRCTASVPKIAALLGRAATARMLVIYSHLPGQTPDNILPEIRPFPGQPVVSAFTDKFLGTNLESILKGANIKTVIIAGTSSNGAVLTTAAEAALREYQVVVPVDLMSATSLYAEQYTAWHLTNSPAIPARITLTRSDMIKF